MAMSRWKFGGWSVAAGVALTVAAGVSAATPVSRPSSAPAPQTAPAASQPVASAPQPVAPAGYNAIAVLHPASGSGVTGCVKFTRETEGVRVEADLAGLAPGRHGFHIHEFGDCSAPDATSAGGHWNPADAPHGAPTAHERHAGDLGNLEAGPDGRARLVWVDTMIRLDGPNSIVGRAVIVHAGADDLSTQPTGNAGGRVACGVVGLARGR